MANLIKKFSTAFFTISVATFIAGLICCVGVLMGIISNNVNYGSFYITDAINLILRIALYVVILVFSISTLKKIFTKQEVDDKKLVKLNSLFLGLFLLLYVITWITSAIEYSVRLGKFIESSASIAALVSTIIGSTFFLLTLSNKFADNRKKVFNIFGYLFFFIYLLMYSVGLAVYAIPFCFFLYFFFLSGLLHTLTYDVNINECFLCRENKKVEDIKTQNDDTHKIDE